MPSNQPFVWKICTKCGAILIANKNNFRKDSKGKYGLRANCNECEKKRKQSPEYKEQEKKRKQSPEYKEKEKKRKQSPKYKEQKKQIDKKYRQTSKYKEKEKKRKQSPKYKEQKKQIDKKYRQQPEIKLKQSMYNHKRRELERNGNGIPSLEIAQEILIEWFLNTCAYSGIEITDKTINWDHIIPLKKNGVNEIWNLVPSYNSYNKSKGAKEPYKWYKEQEYYDSDRLEYIIYYQKVMYWNFANKDTDALVLITGEELTYEEIEEEYGVLEGAE